MTRRLLLSTIVLLTLGSALRADVKPAALFSDHMVIQQDAPVPVWGWADPGENVTVKLGDHKQSTTAGADGKWMVKLDPAKSGAADVVSITGKNTITIHDVLIGEVWLASGQSNMDFSVSKEVKSFAGVQNEDEEIAAANYPRIRQFTVKLKLADEPQKDVEGEWHVCSPETVGAFSAVGYFFARELHQARKFPVGIIQSTWGASTAQCWIGKDVLLADARFKKILEDYVAAVKQWDEKYPPGSEPPTTRGRGGPRNPHQDQHSPYLLWNGMIKPLEPYAIRGTIWYQGESVVGGNELYLPLMQTLIKSWRAEWSQGDFPFLFVQLAAYKAPATQPAPGGGIASVREAQLQTLSVPNTAMAVTIDIGDAKNVHPKNKQDVGKRLALAARAIVYGEKIEYSGPMYESLRAEGDKIRVHFTHADGLKAKGEKLTGFAIAGDDKIFAFAEAMIDGDNVIVSSPNVVKPVAVRYGWADNPPANLYNSAALPASPFRTDQW